MADSSAPARPIFDPVETTFDDVTAKDDVESPSLSSSNALARFEFEPGKSKDGTKVLMVEWEDDDTTKGVKGDWELRWEGKKTVLPAREHSDGEVNRLYFLLGPGVNIPTTVELQKGSSISWNTNPLPAIFSPELGATARQAGKKGVLHTIWAKKRLQVLQNEIANESKDNVEGIGLEMAIAEKEWIEQNFGVLVKPGSISIPSTSSHVPTSPTSPRSPGGGRLMDKLKGLKLGTGAGDLGPASNSNRDPQYNPLSPETGDVAVGTFSNFAALKGMPDPSSLAAKSPQSPSSPGRGAAGKKKQKGGATMVAQAPPQSFAAQQRQSGSASLDAIANDRMQSPTKPPAAAAGGEDWQQQDDLFALPMSPKSAATTGNNHFSFAAQDTSRYLKREKA